MQNVITVVKQLVPIEHIVLVEAFEASANTDVKREKPFRARVVLLDRDNVLAEFTPQEFADIIADEIPKWAAIVRATGVKIAE